MIRASSTTPAPRFVFRLNYVHGDHSQISAPAYSKIIRRIEKGGERADRASPRATSGAEAAAGRLAGRLEEIEVGQRVPAPISTRTPGGRRPGVQRGAHKEIFDALEPARAMLSLVNDGRSG